MLDNLTLPNEVIEKAYDDALHPMAAESGKVLQIIPQTVNAVLLPLRKWILYREYNYQETALLLQEKLKNVNPEKIVTPEPYVGVPALQAISYCMDSKELRNMYANLLAKSMHIDYKNYVHPAFTDIIKQLSPLDVQNLQILEKEEVYPIAEYRVVFEAAIENNRNYIIAQTNVFLENSTCDDLSLISCSISNLHRLGLVSIKYGPFVERKDYNQFKSTSLFFMIKNSLVGQPDKHIEINKGAIRLTPIGESFKSVCMESLPAY